MPPLVGAAAQAGAAGVEVCDDALLPDALLLAATTAGSTGDEIGANYHFRWFQELDWK